MDRHLIFMLSSWTRCASLLVLVFLCSHIGAIAGRNASASVFDVGLILDLDTTLGKTTRTCIIMALEDFYATNEHSKRIVIHTRDAKSDVVEAASAAIDLLKNVRVQAILGPPRSTQADFIINIGNKSRVPIISPATSPSLSHSENPYFIRVSQSGNFQVEPLTALLKAFGWREVVLIYEDSEYGTGIIPYLTDALAQNRTQVTYQSVISASASDDHIEEQLYLLMTMQTRVFVVHTLPPLASRLFLKAKEVGMMSEGYAWIITTALTDLLDTVESNVIDSMQGVIGVKPYVPRSIRLDNFTRRWRKMFRKEYPEMDRFEMNAFGLWAYDSATALAMAVEKLGNARPEFKNPAPENSNLTDLAAIGTSEMGPEFLKWLRNVHIRNGLSGDFEIIDGQLQSSAFQIVNVIGKGEREIGFWTPTHGISRTLNLGNKNYYTTSKDDLGGIIWPGDPGVQPRGWAIPTNGKKLRVGVPVKGGLGEFVTVERDPQTNAVKANGFCIDVFIKVINSLPYAVPYEFVPFNTSEIYDDLVFQVFLGNFDAVVGDVTILRNRTEYVDFTLPYTESGVSMVVPIKDDQKGNAWIFMKPLTADLWLTTGAFFIFTGFVVWVLEHRVNKAFRGPPRQQVGMMLWFSFSTLVFAHREKVINNLTRFVVIVWVFVVLVLTSSYTASLTSMLTVAKLQPTVTDIKDLIKNGEYVGYQQGSFVDGLLKNMKFDPSKFKNYSTIEQYDEALTKGSRNGGVAAIVDELPYLRIFLKKYCKKYILVGPTNRTEGFGFAFPKGSPLVADVSKAILDVIEGGKMLLLEREWLGGETGYAEKDGLTVNSESLNLDSFKGLFLIAGISSFLALIIFTAIFLYENRDILVSEEPIRQKLAAMAKTFDEEKEDLSSSASKKKSAKNGGMESVSAEVAVTQNANLDWPQSPVISVFNHTEGMFSRDEEFSTPVPGTPVHDAIEIVRTTQE
ncbi:hypothetical protein NMG60_11003955 [Bertholletia excelsa]